MGASSLKELNDFENMFIPTSDYIFKKIALKDSILSIEDEFNRALMEDLISAEIIDQNNLYGINFVFNSGLSKTKRSQCLERELPLWKVSLNDFNLL
jgi:predicted P-loop ATPase